MFLRMSVAVINSSRVTIERHTFYLAFSISRTFGRVVVRLTKQFYGGYSYGNCNPGKDRKTTNRFDLMRVVSSLLWIKNKIWIYLRRYLLATKSDCRYSFIEVVFFLCFFNWSCSFLCAQKTSREQIKLLCHIEHNCPCLNKSTCILWSLKLFVRTLTESTLSLLSLSNEPTGKHNFHCQEKKNWTSTQICVCNH